MLPALRAGFLASLGTTMKKASPETVVTDIRRFPPMPFENARPVRERVDHTDRVQRVNVDAAALAAELRRAVEGEVRFDEGARAMYSSDASNYRQVPIGVVLPRSADDVIATGALARKYGAPILARGGRPSLAGQGCTVSDGLGFHQYQPCIT